MATPVFCCGFECGVSGAHWTLSGTGSFSTSNFRNGLRALRANPTATVTTTGAQSVALTSSAIWIIRGYVYFATLPTLPTGILTMQNLGGAFYQSSDSTIRTGTGIVSAFGTSGVTVTTGRWYRLDIKIDATTNPWTIDVSVDGVACAQKTNAVAGSSSTLINCSISQSSAITADVYYDDILVSNTLGDFPLGAGSVNHFIPTSDGTHNVAGTNDFEFSLTGTDILNATTTAYTLVQDVPLPSTAVDFIAMVGPPNATDYVECIFGAPSGFRAAEFAPQAVEVIAAIHQAGTGTGNMEIRLNDNGTTNAVYTATTVAGVTSIAYKRKHYATAPTGGAWKVTSGAGNFNNLRVRFGSPAAVDVNPNQFFDAIMIEAAFAEVPRAGVLTFTRQAVRRASYY